MQRMTTWWRNLGGLLAACVLALLVVAPATSRAACLCAEGVTVASASAQTLEAERHEDGAPCKAACCVGGHCHHAGSLLDAPVVTLDGPARLAAEHALPPTRALASRPPAALDRPPRA